MNVDLTTMDTTPFNPYAAWQPFTYGPFWAEYSSETKYLGTDVPTTNFGGISIQNYDDSWTYTLPAMYDTCAWPARYVKGPLNNNFFAIQTTGSSNAYNC